MRRPDKAGAADRAAGRIAGDEATAALEFLPLYRPPFRGAEGSPGPVTVPTLFAHGLAGRRVGDEVRLGPDEIGHGRALRLTAGEMVALTDGDGHRWFARLQTRSRGRAACVLHREAPVRPPLPIRLAFGIGNKDRTLWLVEKAVELGAAVLEPLEFVRSASVADAARSPAYWERAHRRAISALKQSGGGWLPRIRPVARLDGWLSEPLEDGALRLLADATAESVFGSHLERWTGRTEAVLLIGPEGGIEPQEMESCAAAGFRTGRLGDNTLRFETAAVAALALAAERMTRVRAAKPSATTPPTGRASCAAGQKEPKEEGRSR